MLPVQCQGNPKLRILFTSQLKISCARERMSPMDRISYSRMSFSTDKRTFHAPEPRGSLTHRKRKRESERSLFSTLLHLPPFRFHCVEGCWDRTQDGTLKQTARRSNRSARSHPQESERSELIQQSGFIGRTFHCLSPPVT